MKRTLALALCVVIACSGSDGTGPDGGIDVVRVGASFESLVIGGTSQFSAEARDKNGTVVPGTVTWTSSRPAVATITPAGLASAISAGSSVITATIGGKSGTLNLVVTNGLSIDVEMPGLIFSPFTAMIRRGGVVRFVFPALPHNVIFNNRNANTPADIQQTANVTIARTFSAVGSYPYDCRLHPGMSGEVIVIP